uniref:uncharacterized protein LOC120889763 n=1 Tax=Ictidomys tridecemlineatus TaxID=43179 RepID=UPI001A9EB3BC|nr:uncharacterized protein LOC120889763 [Ictidomys tridecemlineatus]
MYHPAYWIVFSATTALLFIPGSDRKKRTFPLAHFSLKGGSITIVLSPITPKAPLPSLLKHVLGMPVGLNVSDILVIVLSFFRRELRDFPSSHLCWKIVFGQLLFILPKCFYFISWLQQLSGAYKGVPVRSGDATFPKAMDNVTVRQGESATLSKEEEEQEEEEGNMDTYRKMRIPCEDTDTEGRQLCEDEGRDHSSLDTY